MPKFKKYVKTDYPVLCNTCGKAMEPDLFTCPVHGGEFLEGESEDSPCPAFCNYTAIVTRYSPLCDCEERNMQYDSPTVSGYRGNPNIVPFRIKSRAAECDCDVCQYPLYKDDHAYLVDNTNVCCSKLCAQKINAPRVSRGF